MYRIERVEADWKVTKPCVPHVPLIRTVFCPRDADPSGCGAVLYVTEGGCWHRAPGATVIWDSGRAEMSRIESAKVECGACGRVTVVDLRTGETR